MSIQRLSRLRDWQLKDKDQDLNGMVLRAQNGREIGTVIDMVVDTEAGLVTSVVMHDDTHVATQDIDLRDGEIWLNDSAKQPVSESRETSRFVPGELEAEHADSDVEQPNERETSGRLRGDVRPLRDSSEIREGIRRALEEHRRAGPIDVPRDLQQDIRKPDTGGETRSDRRD